MVLVGFASPASSLELCYEDLAFPPYMNGQGTVPKTNRGLLIELIDASYQDLEIEPEYQRRPWLRCQQLVLKGDFDGIIAMINSQERMQEYAFPTPEFYLFKAEYPIFFNADRHPLATINRIAASPNLYSKLKPQFTFGFSSPTGYIAQQKLKQFGMMAPHSYSPNQGLKQVAIQRLDGYVVERVIGNRTIEELKLTGRLQSSDVAFMTSRIYVAFNRQFYRENKTQTDKFWRQLAIHRRSLEQKLELIRD